MTFQTLKINRDARGVATLTLSRPDQHNALNGTMLDEIVAAFAELDRDPAVRVVILTGEGQSFCAGGDLSWMQETLAASRAGRVAQSRKVALALQAANNCGKPIIARVNGAAYGGGFGMVCVGDVVIVADSAKFGLTEVRLGLVPANIAPFVERRIGLANCRRFGLSGRIFKAQMALEIGLASRVVPDAELDAAVEQEVRYFLEAAPEAIAATKALFAYVAEHGDHDNIGYTADRLADAWETDCGREGIRTFLEKTVPSWRITHP